MDWDWLLGGGGGGADRTLGGGGTPIGAVDTGMPAEVFMPGGCQGRAHGGPCEVMFPGKDRGMRPARERGGFWKPGGGKPCLNPPMCCCCC